MIKKNRHCAGRKKHERILKAQRQTALEHAVLQFQQKTGIIIDPAITGRQNSEYRSSMPPGLTTETINLTEENTVSLSRYHEVISQRDSHLDPLPSIYQQILDSPDSPKFPDNDNLISRFLQ